MLPALLLLMTAGSQAQVSLAKDSIAMGGSYANEIYYSMPNGQVAEVPRSTWDIAFRTMIMSSCIITNDGCGVVLYTYPNADTNGWAMLDTTGLSTWTPMFNDPDDWELGAFNRNAGDHPDYGWGVYNSVTHNLVGDSLFVIQLRDGSFKKLQIVRKISAQSTYVFKYANLDGSNEEVVNLNCNTYATKDFVGIDLTINQVVDFQPAKDSWDLLFTKYMSVQPNGSPYIVTGVLSNDGVGETEYWSVDTSYADWSANEFDFSRSPIGWNWKTYTGSTPPYAVDDSLVFFVKALPGDVYKLIFTRFDGSMTGKIVFLKGIISTSGLEDNASSPLLALYPNPSSDYLHLQLDPDPQGTANVRITDMLGKTLYQQSIPGGTSQEVLTIPVSDWQDGLYFISIIEGNQTHTGKFLVRK